MINLGDVRVNEVIEIPFNTFSQVNGSALDPTVVLADIEIYKDGGTTKRSSTAGFTLSKNFNSITGVHRLIVNLADDTDIGFYAQESEYKVLINTMTVDSQTLNRWIGVFTIEKRIGQVVADRVITGATHNIVNSIGRRMRGLQEFQGYEGGAIHIDTINGVPGTDSFEHGTAGIPSSNITDSIIIANNVGLEIFNIRPSSIITLLQSHTNHVFLGENWTLILGGQIISGGYIHGANVSGIALGGINEVIYEDCIFTNFTIPGNTVIRRSYFAGDITAGSAGDFFINDCRSRVAGSATPKFDFGASNNASDLNMRNYSGGIEIMNMGVGTGSYQMSLEGQGQLIINANCTGGLIEVRGNFQITDNSGGAVIINDTANFGSPIGIQKNVALPNFPFAMVDSVTKKGKNGLTINCTRSIDGASFAACANSPVEVGGGGYKINFADSDLNGKTIIFRATATGADDRYIIIVTQ